MGEHGAAGGLGIAAPEGGEDAAMSGDRGRDAEAADGAHAGMLEEAGEDVEEEDEERVPRGFGENAVEAHVGLDAGGEGGGLPEFVESAGGPAEVVVAGADGGEGGDPALEGAAHFDEIGEGPLGAAEHEVEAADGGLGMGGPEPGAASLGELDESLSLEDLEGLAEDGAGDPEGLPEAGLGGKAPAGTRPSRQEMLPQAPGRLRGERLAGFRADRPQRRHAELITCHTS